MIGYHPLISKLLVIIIYFILSKDPKAFPEYFLPLAWIPLIVFLYLHHFFDGMQNATRNIARIYLLHNHGIGYDKSFIVPIQLSIFPDSLKFISFLYFLSEIGSFSIILIYQGWAVAIISLLAAYLLTGLIPINYTKHLKRIFKYLMDPKCNALFNLTRQGIRTNQIVKMIDKSIKYKINLQDYWAIYYSEKLSEKIN